MTDFIIGYKGFKQLPDGTLKCLDLIYQPGRIYVTDSVPELCKKGFHFCENLKDVNPYYRFADKNNVFFRVKASGIIKKELNGNKSTCSQLEILEKVSEKEIVMVQLDEKIKIVDKILESNPNVVISGSLALVLRGCIEFREIGDVDVTLPFYSEFKNGRIDSHFGDSGKECIKMIIESPKAESHFSEISFDLFINPSQVWDEIEYRGRKYKVSRLKNIIDAKFRYFMDGKLKHGEDLKKFIDSYNDVRDDAMNRKDWNVNFNSITVEYNLKNDDFFSNQKDPSIYTKESKEKTKISKSKEELQAAWAPSMLTGRISRD